MSSIATERVYGIGIVRAVSGDWRPLVGGRIKTATGQEILRTRLLNRLLAAKDGWYGRPGEGIGLNEWRGRPMNENTKREILRRVETLRQDPAVLDIRHKSITVETATTATGTERYVLLNLVILTREGELRFTDGEAFQVGL